MSHIELIYDNDCPNVEATRAELRSALGELRLPPEWKEWERNGVSAPKYVKHYGSPTILVDGEDIVKSEIPNGSNSCRVYQCGEKLSGIPSSKLIKTALSKNRADSKPSRLSWKSSIATLPAIGAVLIPGLTCPACWPGYAALLSSLGLGFFNYTPYLFPVALILLAVALLGIGYKCYTQGQYGPLLLASAAAVSIFLGKFVVGEAIVLYLGIGGMIIAAIWNLKPLRKLRTEHCEECS